MEHASQGKKEKKESPLLHSGTRPRQKQTASDAVRKWINSKKWVLVRLFDLHKDLFECIYNSTKGPDQWRKRTTVNLKRTNGVSCEYTLKPTCDLRTKTFLESSMAVEVWWGTTCQGSWNHSMCHIKAHQHIHLWTTGNIWHFLERQSQSSDVEMVWRDLQKFVFVRKPCCVTN